MFDKVLSMPLVKNIPGFWIAQDLEYTSGSKCARFLICQNSEYGSGFDYSMILNTPVLHGV